VLPAPEPPPPLDLKPPEKPKPVEKPKPPQPKPRSVAAAPQAAPEQTERAAAPAPGATPEPPSASLPTWKGLLLRHLERHKRYPSEAQRARQEGVVYVRFTMSRDGRVLAARIERATGVVSLDQEGLDLLRRAQPLPPLPSDQPGESLELLVPVQFYLKR
jgi:protein TonB